MIRVFKALDRLASISGPKDMARKARISYNSGISPINIRFFGRNFGTRNARKSIKPSEHSCCSLITNKKSSQKMAPGVGF